MLQTHIPKRLLECHYAEQNPTVFGKREVILSLYLSGINMTNKQGLFTYLWMSLTITQMSNQCANQDLTPEIPHSFCIM